MQQLRPQFLRAWNSFAEINISVKNVGDKIGGFVEKNIDSGIFQNACPIRMSYVLNKSGINISRGKYAMVSGEDKKQYMYRVNDMIRFLNETFGVPDLEVKQPRMLDFQNKKGIIVFTGSGWSNARGHITLWNGVVCSDACHFMGSPDNGPFVPEKAYLWSLK